LMRVVIGFDVDGTLECGWPPGVIKLASVLALKRRGFIVGVIGAYERVPEKVLRSLDFAYGGHPNKPRYLREVVERFGPDLMIYVGDEDRDRDACAAAGVVYVRPEDFRVPWEGRDI